ncbi:hypothetical protein CL657_00655 [bacterium]|nr:hypothetical protein [bacterium]|tara:strand:- start:1122 stop:1604 length:483 start_codon:yes stop_codon:yes gene_type:complete
MLKKIIIWLLLGASSLYAFEFDAVVPFSGTQSPAATFYKQLPFVSQDISLVVGLSAIVPGSKTEELDTDLKLGVRTEVPLLGMSDIYFTFDNHGGVARQTSSSDFYTRSLSLAKTWVYPFTDRMELGVQAVLGQVLLNGEYQGVLLPAVYPVIKLNVNLF